MIPAARVQGGAGGGRGIRDDEVQWRPAIDVNKVIPGVQVIAVAALLLARAVVKSRAAHQHEAA
jgi:hypothetical protein